MSDFKKIELYDSCIVWPDGSIVKSLIVSKEGWEFLNKYDPIFDLQGLFKHSNNIINRAFSELCFKQEDTTIKENKKEKDEELLSYLLKNGNQEVFVTKQPEKKKNDELFSLSYSSSYSSLSYY